MMIYKMSEDQKLFLKLLKYFVQKRTLNNSETKTYTSRAMCTLKQSVISVFSKKCLCFSNYPKSNFQIKMGNNMPIKYINIFNIEYVFCSLF